MLIKNIFSVYQSTVTDTVIDTAYAAHLLVLCWFSHLSSYDYRGMSRPVWEHLLCFRLSVPGNDFCKQQPTSPSASVENYE